MQRSLMIALASFALVAPALAGANDSNGSKFLDREAIVDMANADDAEAKAEAEAELDDTEMARDDAQMELDDAEAVRDSEQMDFDDAEMARDDAQTALDEAIDAGAPQDEIDELQEDLDDDQDALDTAQMELDDVQDAVDSAQMDVDDAQDVVDMKQAIVDMFLEEEAAVVAAVEEMSDAQVIAFNRSVNDTRHNGRMLDLDSDFLEALVDGDWNGRQIQAGTKGLEAEAKALEQSERFLAKHGETGDNKFQSHSDRVLARGERQKDKFFSKVARFGDDGGLNGNPLDEVRAEVKRSAKAEAKGAAKQAAKAEAKQLAKNVAKQAARAEAKNNGKALGRN